MRRSFVTGLAVFAATAASAGDADKLRTELEPMAFLIGSCWQGEFPGAVQTDVHCFDSVYDGVHIRDRHAVSGGASLYQGETIYSWNGDAREISFVYWNSLGGVSTGTATPTNDGFVFPEETYIGPDGESVIVSSSWENISAASYDQLSVETFTNGTTRERRVHFENRPFTDDPAGEKLKKKAALVSTLRGNRVAIAPQGGRYKKPSALEIISELSGPAIKR